jgi:hypothetical protein
VVQPTHPAGHHRQVPQQGQVRTSCQLDLSKDISPINWTYQRTYLLSTGPIKGHNPYQLDLSKDISPIN